MTLFNSYYDIIFFGIITFSAILAFIRGGVAEILSLSSWFIAFWLMHKIGDRIDHLLPNNITDQTLRHIIAFIVIFVVVAILITIIKKLLSSVILAIGLSGINYLIGIIFGIIRGILICAVLIVIVQLLHLDTKHTYQRSHLYPILEPVSHWISSILPNQVPVETKDAIGLYKSYTESGLLNESPTHLNLAKPESSPIKK